MPTLPSGTVTFLFTDIEGSTRLLEALGRDRYGEMLREHQRLLREVWQRHRGFEVDTEGDAFFVAFAQASEALAAAADAQRALAHAQWPQGQQLRVRIGVHSGEASVHGGDYVGMAVHRAARIAAATHGGQILVSESTKTLAADERLPGTSLRDLGLHRLKDLTEPQRLHQLLVDGLPHDFPPPKTLGYRPTNLPTQLTSLIGRERELAELRGLLEPDEVRLLTLTGPGGTGKTRLALQFGAEEIERFADGVWFVALAAVREPELVPPTIAQTLGVREQPGEPIEETLAEYLRDRETLVVLDNFEQVTAAARSLPPLLAAASRLKLVVTSRARLHVSGERTYAVPPLSVPDRDLSHVAAVQEYESVLLFVERAQAANAGFALNEENAAAVAEICVRLDGLPLALELAAARVRVLPPRALLARLDQRLKLLRGSAADVDERQRTLRGTIEWSYDLLSSAEKVVFARLAVFVDGARLDEAGAVCGDDGSLEDDVFDVISSLVEKSLLRQREDPDGEPRFWMLETIREYGLDVLRDSGALEETGRLHALNFLEVAERVDQVIRREDPSEAFDRLESDVANLRAALQWLREQHEDELISRFATALWGFWATRGYLTEGRAVLEDVVARGSDRSARALLGLCALRSFTGGGADDLMPLVTEAIEKSELAEDTFSLAQAWNLLGKIQGSLLGNHGEAEQSWQKGLAVAEAGNYPGERAEIMGWLMISAVFGPLPVEDGIARCNDFLTAAGEDKTVAAFARIELAVLEAMRGNFDRARQLLAEGTQTFRALGLNVWAANNAQEAYFVEMLAGNPRAAATTLRASYDALEQMGETGFLSTIAGFLAQALCALGEYEEAEKFSRASEAKAAPDDAISQIFWRTTRAKVYAQRGDHRAAEELAREAVTLARATDLLSTQADAFVDLADVLASAGRHQEAHTLLDDAARKYAQKGNTAALSRVRQPAQR